MSIMPELKSFIATMALSVWQQPLKGKSCWTPKKMTYTFSDSPSRNHSV
jgi:hypothetical protein